MKIILIGKHEDALDGVKSMTIQSTEGVEDLNEILSHVEEWLHGLGFVFHGTLEIVEEDA